MASLDSLPADQRAVLQLVLQRGRRYEDIAKLLSIDRDAVRQRALTALETLGPRTALPQQRRALITDYLLGQLSDDVADQTRERLAESPAERAWARVLASELGPLAKGPLPEIPVEAGAGSDTGWDDEGSDEGVAPEEDDEGPDEGLAPEDDDADAERSSSSRLAEPAVATAPPPTARVQRGRGAGGEPPRGRPGGTAPSSRRGGVILIAGVVAVAVIVALVLLLTGGKSKSSHSSSNSATASQSATTPSGSSSTTSSTAARVVAQINLTPPTAGSKAAGIAEVLKEGANNGIAIVAQNVTPNTTKPPNAYAVWLYNSPTDAKILGFVNPGVGKNGRLSTAGGLPANASHFKQLIVTEETQANPKAPGTVILQGTLTGVS
ncbi:MAG TPA: sigma factor-like helix-turn-helix DNA-binding protein [Solirubrobacteraceae bacterium]|jgi:hypothetical protein